MTQRTEHFLIETDTRSHISELVVHFGVSRRNLYRAFHEVHGMPPGRFIDYKRIGHAHTALLAAVPGVETVEGVARHHGFNHLGRFSKKYQSHFGELPSETLYRRS
jgi:transcriptional regulator GlxA family with amidase domain